jgi:protein-ribulosamine 3-kinase
MKEGLRVAIMDRLAVSAIDPHPVSGGSINEAWHISAGGHQYFCKVNSSKEFPGLFQKETEGLRLIAATGAVLTPLSLQYFEQDDLQLLMMEWIEPGVSDDNFWKIFGRQLAELHSFTSDTCGLENDNYLGSIHQSNKENGSWIDFFRRERLEPMVERNLKRGRLDPDHLHNFDSLYLQLPKIFGPEDFSLLHGDLWNGNFLVNRDSLPVLIDPAVYYGHRCMDIGMTMLFGGFDRTFYDAYNYHYPLDDNYIEQCNVCNLYPLLIHLELFGRSYLGQIETILKKYS